jgi:hypothetical protein
MMGNRNHCTQDEFDAFSRRTRRVICWSRGETQAIKRRFWKRVRTEWRMKRSQIVRGKQSNGDPQGSASL